MNHFALAYREQQLLFVYEKTFLASTLLKAGGLSALIARFFVQFFWTPLSAMTITVILLALCSYLTWALISTSQKDWQSTLLSIAPACFIGASLSDNNLHFDYLTSILLVEGALILYKYIRSKRISCGILMTIILYLTAGPSTVIFSVCACMMDFARKSPEKQFSFTYPIASVVCGVVFHIAGATPTLSSALSPSFHYEIGNVMPAFHLAAWIALPLTMVNHAIKSGKARMIVGIFASLLSFAFCHMWATGIDKKGNATGYEYEYYTTNERWDDLTESCKQHLWSPGTANYMNLAAAYKGTLTEDLLKYDNRGVSSLLLIPESKTVDVRVAHIMFAMGNIAAAQNVAFNAMFTSEGYAPAMLKMNTQIELMRGEYEVAEKYLSILRKTIHYRKWAEEHSRFLWDDNAVVNDLLLGNGRKDFPHSDGFAMFGNPIDELMKVIEANPGDYKAMQYGLSFLLLSKDIARLQQFINKFWGTPALQTLPVAAQEAMIFYSEYSRHFEGVEPIELEWCTTHGVTQTVIDRFTTFQQASLKSNGTTPSGYKGTYWHYLISKQS